MTYPGNPELSAQAQERVMSAFRQVVTKIQDGLTSEALIGLEFVLRLDPTFAPGVAIQEQLINGQAEIDLSSVISQLESPDTDAINLLLIEAVEAFNQHNYLEAREKVEKVLIDLPGHAEARSLAVQIEDSLKVSTQVGQFLAQAKEALDENRPQDAANFVLMAQALDPHHSGIEATLAEINKVGASAQHVAVAPPQEKQASDFFEPPPSDVGQGFGDHPSTPLIQPPPSGPEPLEHDFAASEGFSTQLADETDSDSWDVAGAFEEPVFEPDQSHAPQPEVGGFEFGGDVADLFEASSDSPEESLWQEPEPAKPIEQEGPDPVEDLLARGTEALDTGDPQEALHHLSRILLLDPDNTQASELIDRARTAIDAMELRLQSSLSESEMAWDSGHEDRARAIVEEILFTAPGNEDALALKARFDSSALDAAVAPPALDEPLLPPVPGDVPPYEDDVSEDIDLFEDFDSSFDQLDSEPPAPTEISEVPRGGRRIPWRLVFLGSGALVVVLSGMWLGSKFLPGGEGDVDTARVVSQRIENAQSLFDQGKGEEALELLRTFDVDGIDKQRIDKHIARFEAALTPPTPTPTPESVELGQSLLDEGRWFEAYQAVDAGLAQHPGDSGLLGMREEIATIEPRVSSLFAALGKKDFQACALLAGELAARHPDQKGFGLILDKCLFNAALTHLRAYNLSGARGHLQRLQERNPTDEDVSRILEFISSYSNRPVDMQLEIFVGSLDFR